MGVGRLDLLFSNSTFVLRDSNLGSTGDMISTLETVRRVRLDTFSPVLSCIGYSQHSEFIQVCVFRESGLAPSSTIMIVEYEL